MQSLTQQNGMTGGSVAKKLKCYYDEIRVFQI